MAVDCGTTVTQQCVALTFVDVEGRIVQRSSQLWRDSSVVRALVRITRGPGLDPQLRCLNFFVSSFQCQCFLSFVCCAFMVQWMYLPSQDQPFLVFKFVIPSPHNIYWCRPLLAVDCGTAVTQQCVAPTLVDVEGRMVQRSSQLWRDSSVVRALVRITRGPGFDPQLRCLNFFVSPSQCQCFLSFDWCAGTVQRMYLPTQGQPCLVFCHV